MVNLLVQKGLHVVHAGYEPEIYYVYNDRMLSQQQFLEVQISGPDVSSPDYAAQIDFIALDDNSSYQIPILRDRTSPASILIWYRVILDVIDLINILDFDQIIETLKDPWIGYGISKEKDSDKAKDYLFNEMTKKFENIMTLVAQNKFPNASGT